MRQNGERGVLVSVIKNGGSSTLDIVSSLLAQLPIVEQILPKNLKITPLFDQSGFVRAAISGVVREALIAACLTAALILVFLGNWRSTCIIAVSIPLSILSSIIALYIMGETLNIMTFGGLALAVGILVAFDIATARYRGGVDTYLEMITAQQALLSNQRQAVQVHGQQFATAVYLVKALGGGWSKNGS